MADHIEGPLYYERMGRTGPVMAFVHPNPMDQSCWIFQMAHMSTWFRCIAIDIPGYGRSPKARDGLTMNDMAEGCWETIETEFAAEPAILVGCSVGSAILPYMHHARPDKTKALIMCGTGYNPGKEFTTHRIKQYTDRGISYRWDYTFEDLSPAFRQTPLAMYFAELFAERNAHADLDTIIRQFLALKAADAADHFWRVKCPSIILTGSEDGTHKSAFALKEQIPNCEMRILHGAGHACQIEQPWLFDRYMIDFLDKHGLFPVTATPVVDAPARAAPSAWPDGFRGRDMPVTGGTQYVRVGGNGPAVILLHGFGDTGDMWVPLAARLVKDHTVIVPDLRGLGLSSHPDGGYEKVAQARDLAALLNQLGVKDAALVTHDIGNMVGYAFAALYPQRVPKWVVMDAPLPGIGHWDDQLKNPKTWHFNFRGPDVERLVAGRERILLDRFYNELSANPTRIDEQTREHYAALYARPGAIRAAFSGQFGAFAQDAIDNQQLLAKGKLTMPVLAIGGDHSYGAQLAAEVGFAAANVRAAVIKDAGHWIMEEQPERAVALITSFISE